MEFLPTAEDLRRKPLVEERLKVLSAQLIAARRRQDHALILAYARQAGVVTGTLVPPNLFTKTIHVFHPDRLAGIWDRIETAFRTGDRAALGALARLLELRPDRSGDPGFPEEPEGPEGPAPGPFGEPDVWESDGGDWDSGEDAEEGTFLWALARGPLWRLGRTPGSADLARLTGHLDLSGWDLHDLDGLEFCRGLTGLNLSANNLDNLFCLKDLTALEFLDLSSNGLEDADWVGNLVRLRELDLSGNDLDDVAFLGRLPRLRSVDLTGNPVRTRAVLERLEARGVMVIR